MLRPLGCLLVGLGAVLVCCQPLPGQPPAAGQQRVPPRFQLNTLEQAYLDQVLLKWEEKGSEIVTFSCPFERWEYNAAFGPGQNLPLSKDKGELTYQKPDKGSFQIMEIRRWQAKPAEAGQQASGDWVEQPDAIGEHWVCDGESVYEYRHEQKQLVERPIPEEMQGKAIVDGPLPFLFGADADKLKARYWMRIEQQKDQQKQSDTIWIQAWPKHRQDAANFQAVELMLDRQRMLPTAMKVYLPDGGQHLYLFDLAGATVNGTLDRIQALFSRPKTPWGWTRVVEEPPAEPPNSQRSAQAREAVR